MILAKISQALIEAVESGDICRASILRLVKATINDRIMAAKAEGFSGELSEDDVRAVLETMVKHRRESIKHYEDEGQFELIPAAEEEIRVIDDFLPSRLDGEALLRASREVINEIGATGLRDMGRAITALKQRYEGQLDTSKANVVVRDLLM